MKRGWRVAACAGLLLSSAALLITSRPGVVSWEALLAPYSDGTPLVGDFRIIDMRRGSGNDVVLRIGRPSEPPTIQVHILPRGAWPGVHESTSFSIGYETPHSPAPEREAVTDIIAQTVRARDDGLPSPGAIPLRAADATVLPWWLEMLRGGHGLLLGTSLILLAMLALVPSPVVSVGALGWSALALAAVVVAPPAWSSSVGAPWTLLLAAPLFIAVARRCAPQRRDIVLAFAVSVAALLLRLGLGSWGPLHVNGQGPRFVDGAARNPDEIAVYGPGYVELFGPLAGLAPAGPDWAIFAANAILSALTVTVAFGVARLAGLSLAHAIGAATVLALDPVSIRMGATEAYFPSIILLCLIGAAALLLSARAYQSGRQWPAVAGIVAAALLLAQAARVHPSAWGLIACTPFIILAAPAGGFGQRLGLLLAGVVLTGGMIVATSAEPLLDVFNNIRGGTLMRPPEPSSLWPLAGVAAATLAYFLIAPRRWLAIPGGMCAAAWLMTRHGYDQGWLWQQSYDRLYLTIPLIALTAAVPAGVLRRGWVAVPAMLVLTGAWLRDGLPIITARTTDHLEYRWLREQIAELPPDCRVVHLVSADKRVLGIPAYVPASRPAVAIDLRQPHTLEAATRVDGCTYYVRTSLCSCTEGRPACAAVEERLTLRPFARVGLPAVPSSHLLSYDRNPVEVSIARVSP